MEINKILSNLNILGASNVSETSKKGEVIKAETTTSNVQDVDENSQLNLDKETVTKESTSENYDFMNFSSGDDVRDLKGTTYVVVCGPDCSRCTKFEPTLQELANELGDKANFMKLNTSNDKESFRWELVHEAEGGKSKRSSLGFPAIIKVVDGKAVEVMDYHDLGKTVYDTTQMTELLDSKIEGEIDKNQKTMTNKTTETKAEEQTGEETTTKEAELLEDKKTESDKQLVLKQKLDSLKQNLEVMNEVRKEITTDALENAISNATSISDLKDVISIYSSNLDFELQINLSSVVNEFNSDDDVDSAKEQLLEML